LTDTNAKARSCFPGSDAEFGWVFGGEASPFDAVEFAFDGELRTGKFVLEAGASILWRTDRLAHAGFGEALCDVCVAGFTAGLSGEAQTGCEEKEQARNQALRPTELSGFRRHW
jgi:hypothetical protein